MPNAIRKLKRQKRKRPFTNVPPKFNNGVLGVALLDRLTSSGEGPDRIPIHGFVSSLYEWAAGAVTRAQVIAAWSITAEEETELDWLQARYVEAPAGKKISLLRVIKNVLYLGELDKMTSAQVQARIASAAADNDLI